jgi:flagellar motility protein MotE (MotC chaperone)
VRVFLLASALIGLPVAEDHGAEPKHDASHAPGASDKAADRVSTPGITRVSEPGFTKGGRGELPKAVAPDPKKKKQQEQTTKKVVDKARAETAEMLDEVRGVISSMEKGEPVAPDVTVLPSQKEDDGKTCDLELPQILAFELQRVRAVRDEAAVMLDLHEKNVIEIEAKLEQLEAARQQLDKSRAALEETLSRKSTVDDEKEKERRRLRLLLSSRQMKPKKIAALMEEISLEEARVLLEALPEQAAKAVLEALPPERLAQIVGQKKPPKPEATTATSAKSKETL